jgi:hypothetical protein
MFLDADAAESSGASSTPSFNHPAHQRVEDHEQIEIDAPEVH